jgi:hypothetical protein
LRHTSIQSAQCKLAYVLILLWAFAYAHHGKPQLLGNKDSAGVSRRKCSKK